LAFPIKPAAKEDAQGRRRQGAERWRHVEQMIVDTELSMTARVAGVYISTRINGETSHAHVSAIEVAKAIGRGERGRQAQAAIRELVERGHYEVKRGRREWTRFTPLLQERREVAGLGDQDRQEIAAPDLQERREIAGLDDQDRQEIASRPAENRRHTLTSPNLRERGTAFGDKASAVAAVIEAAGLAEGDAAILRGFRFNVEAQRLVANSQTAFITIRTCAGSALDRLGLGLSCGAAR
jgi:hypothetical protein